MYVVQDKRAGISQAALQPPSLLPVMPLSKAAQKAMTAVRRRLVARAGLARGLKGHAFQGLLQLASRTTVQRMTAEEKLASHDDVMPAWFTLEYIDSLLVGVLPPAVAVDAVPEEPVAEPVPPITPTKKLFSRAADRYCSVNRGCLRDEVLANPAAGKSTEQQIKALGCRKFKVLSQDDRLPYFGQALNPVPRSLEARRALCCLRRRPSIWWSLRRTSTTSSRRGSRMCSASARTSTCAMSKARRMQRTLLRRRLACCACIGTSRIWIYINIFTFGPESFCVKQVFHSGGRRCFRWVL